MSVSAEAILLEGATIATVTLFIGSARHMIGVVRDLFYIAGQIV